MRQDKERRRRREGKREDRNERGEVATRRPDQEAIGRRKDGGSEKAKPHEAMGAGGRSHPSGSVSRTRPKEGGPGRDVTTLDGSRVRDGSEGRWGDEKAQKKRGKAGGSVVASDQSRGGEARAGDDGRDGGSRCWAKQASQARGRKLRTNERGSAKKCQTRMVWTYVPVRSIRSVRCAQWQASERARDGKRKTYTGDDRSRRLQRAISHSREGDLAMWTHGGLGSS